MALLLFLGCTLLSELLHTVSALDSSLFSSQSSECVNFISEYPPTVSLYASQICHVCQGLSISPSIEPCCATGNPTACFASSFYGITVTDASQSNTITVAPASFTGSANCDAVLSILRSCEAATPGFDDLRFDGQQSCFCTKSGVWDPSYFDDYWSSCLAWASTAAPSSYSELGPNADGVVESRKCQSWHDFTASGGTVSPTTQASVTSTTSVSLASAGSNIQVASSTGIAAPKHEQMQISGPAVFIFHVVTYYVLA